MKKNQHKQEKQKTKNSTSAKKKEPLWLWGGLALFIIIGAGAYFYYQPPSTLSARATPEQIVLGEQLFSENCLSCHGQKPLVKIRHSHVEDKKPMEVTSLPP